MTILEPKLRFNITATSRALPSSDPITNLDILRHFPRTADKSLSFQTKFAEKIGEEFGFHKRYWSHKPWEPLDKSRHLNAESLALKVVSQLIERYHPQGIQAFLLGSTTNTRFTGSQAAAVMGKLGLNLPAYDLKTGCSTSLSTMHLAYALLQLGYKNCLICCSETLSKVIDPESELTWFGLADGAASIFIEQNPQGSFSVEKCLFSTEGKYVDAFTTQGIFPPTHEQIDSVGYHLVGDEQLMKALALSHYQQLINQLLPTQKERDEITWIIPHQVNRKLMDHLLDEFRMQNKVMLWDADSIGNIGGASILYTLARAVEDDLFDRSGKILLMSVGGGLSYAGQIINYVKS
ncbi:3-oxoacyl-ACP synthase III family protein [Legionella waltersii]|uniref:3-oxoacyl-ACP synthase n=1 Tax=Legionella waltersii TaxID=66969 RepID=A0A0W0ZZV3_9GAMM|nr:3-oxoacyl-[acyl-carrier-protein] synthase III C-terminal domain-containing protein [Legionella waltersii]KTD74623.1 3-oxoacyl-ACP synthase [Legionella waltersii]SNV08863.1 3-oxoacyl-ACP synthase [Legionella waltersii]